MSYNAGVKRHIPVNGMVADLADSCTILVYRGEAIQCLMSNGMASKKAVRPALVPTAGRS